MSVMLIQRGVLRRGSLRGTATVALVCGALLVVPAGASANADVCQPDSLRSYVCIKIFGSDR
jgi:hypothetical protein